jgi:dihydroneopterin aldolase
MNAPRIADAQRALRHIFLRDMVLNASVGVHAFEHDARQRIRINVDLGVQDDAATQASRAAPGRDDLSGVVDYEAVAQKIRAIIATGHVRLLETLAERMAESCLADPRVQLARIRVEKLDIFTDTASVGVEIERRANTSSGFIPHSL